MKNVFLFDVDGTLAPANEAIDSHFMHWFENWAAKRDVYICTNNTYQNILPRLGNRLLSNCKALFTSGGCSIWMNGKEVVTSNWRPPSDLINFLEDAIKQSQFKIRSGPNIEYRTGLISFSIVGKNASKEERQRFLAWDKSSRERSKIIEKINELFPNLDAFSSGDTSIDVCEKGSDKSQVLKYFTEAMSLTFIGNETRGMGNDKLLAQAIVKSKRVNFTVHSVNSWQETFDFLKKIK